MITDIQMDELYELVQEIELESVFLFVVYESQRNNGLVGIDVLDYANEDLIDGGWMDYSSAMELINSYNKDGNE